MSMEYIFSDSVPLYTAGGSGFINEYVRRTGPDELRIPELSSAFIPLFWLADSDLSRLMADGHGVYIDSRSAAAGAGLDGRYVPLIWRTDVSDNGNYRVKITIDNSCGDDDEIMIFIGRRRLYFKGKIRSGEVFIRSFDVNVCSFIPRGYKTEFDIKSIDIAVVGSSPRLSGVEIERIDTPTVYIGGDSTLTDQSADYPYHPSASYSGWGQMISAFFKNGVAVSNHAHSGLTTHTFRAGGHYDIVKKNIKPGDFFIFQFAHNDQKVDFLRADTGYRERMIAYCDEITALGAHPVIVTPLARNSWLGGGDEYNDLLYEYDKECKRLGDEIGVPVIGLHDFMMEKITLCGLEAAKKYFYPGDFTHTCDQGAYMCARFVAEHLPWPLSSYLNTDAPDWETQEGIKPPTPPEAVAKNHDGDVIRDEDGKLTRADAADMLIRAAHYFISNVYNDMYSDVIGHETYAGAVECAYENGIIPPYLTRDGKFRPDEEITLADFAVMAAGAYTSRRKKPELMPCPFDDDVDDEYRAAIRTAYSAGIIRDGDALTSPVGRRRAAEICRIMGL